MAVFITTNTIGSAKKQLAVNQAVSEAIGEREGTFRVSITEIPEKNTWNIAVKGPNGSQKHHFEGKECTPAAVGSAIRDELEKSDAELATALSELVKEGVMFTSEVRPDGKLEYVIDRIRLTGEEVKHLKNRGALTRRGIEQYLVERR